jgi:hypothetical protein
MAVPTHGDSCAIVKFYETKCRRCENNVYYYQCTCGSKVFLDTPQVEHGCSNSARQNRNAPNRRREILRHVALTKSEINALLRKSNTETDWSKSNGIFARRVVLKHNNPDDTSLIRKPLKLLWQEYFESLTTLNLCPICFKPIRLINRKRVPKNNACAAVVDAHFLVTTLEGKAVRNQKYTGKLDYRHFPRQTIFDQRCRC